MLDTEIKWYIVAKLGCSFGRSRITTDKFLHNKLKEKLETNDIEKIATYLHNLGFKILGNPQRDTYIDYINEVGGERKSAKIQREYRKYKTGISKPCFRENACSVTV